MTDHRELPEYLQPQDDLSAARGMLLAGCFGYALFATLAVFGLAYKLMGD